MTSKLIRTSLATALALASAVTIAACGGSSNSSGGSGSGGSTRGTVQFLMSTAPQSLDPALGYTSQSEEVNWLVYTGLVSYRHVSGTAGTQLIAGLATALPKITDGGKTYTVTLRKGLAYSNGAAVKATDFAYTVERAIKIPWGGAGSFLTPIIVGAQAYANGKAKTISGITSDDATGKIVIHLTAPYGPFDNVLAFPALGLVPSGTPMKVESTNPPPGVGPYEVTNIAPNQSFDVVENPQWSKMNIPGIPAGYENIDVKIDSNVAANALSVLDNSADIFDWADTVPGSLMPQIKAKAADRFKLVDLGGSTFYIFLNSLRKPFSSQLAREAVITGLNQNAMNTLGSGTLDPACFFLPPAVPGHPTNAKCPYGTPGDGNIAKAKQLIKESGMEGQPVTVWSQMRQPRLQWMTYYTSFLNEIGLKATIKGVSDANYFTVIGEMKSVNPQTGFSDWVEDFPNPVDFYGPILDGESIQPTNSENNGTNDPYINAEVKKLGATPTTELYKVRAEWQKLDEYVAKKAYIAVFGYQKYPFFTSDRIVYSTNLINPIFGWDFSQFKLK